MQTDMIAVFGQKQAVFDHMRRCTDQSRRMGVTGPAVTGNIQHTAHSPIRPQYGGGGTG